MPVTIIPFGEPANESEKIAIQMCKVALESRLPKQRWVLATNYTSSSSPLFQSDELDILCIGSGGFFVVEVKHWDSSWIRQNQQIAEDEAEKLTAKTRRLAGRVRRVLPSAPRLQQWMLLTREQGSSSSTLDSLRGVPVKNRKSIGSAFPDTETVLITDDQIDSIVRELDPRARIQLDGKVRRIGQYLNLELRSLADERFHRIYSGVHNKTKEKIVLHLYDMSASDERDSQRLVEREWKAYQALQKSRWIPRTRDSLQDLPGYPGELKFFTLLDSGAPNISNRSDDLKWPAVDRVRFAADALSALAEIHQLEPEPEQIVLHRQLAPTSLLVASGNKPLFVDFSVARLPNTQTLGEREIGRVAKAYAAPEVQKSGISSASMASDTYSLCAILTEMLKVVDDPLTNRATEILATGLIDAAEKRSTTTDLSRRMRDLEQVLQAADTEPLGQPHASEPLPAPEYWCEGQVIPLGHDRLQILGRLGAGGIGRAFKVERIEGSTGEEVGTYVAKVISREDIGRKALSAYKRVQSHSAAPGLAAVFHTAEDWNSDGIIALLRWIEGDSLDTLEGVLPIVSEDQGLDSIESLATRWLYDALQALQVLHENKLVHGDVSPKNLIYAGENIVLTDFDLVTQIGQRPWGSGAEAFISTEAQAKDAARASDDVYALCASLFQVLFGHRPFPTTHGAIDKGRGLDWKPGERASIPLLADFFDKATNARADERFANAATALAALRVLGSIQRSPSGDVAIVGGYSSPTRTVEQLRTKQQVPWLAELLSSYPGSPTGNIESRGLDSDFAVATYVPTSLEKELIRAIREREARLVILCGNAGDGKTALLQHVAAEFGVPHAKSAVRIWETNTADGQRIRANLDGSASWNGRSSAQLLDEHLGPFLHGVPESDVTHLLAINDGRLYEWIEEADKKHGASKLTRDLRAFLREDGETVTDSHVRFISLNQRSLVGGRGPQSEDSATSFLDSLIERFLGGRKAQNIWTPCKSCSSFDRCTAGQNAHNLLAASESGASVIGRKMLAQIKHALQAVHQRGDIHITARELRGALAYILFGVNRCSEVHELSVDSVPKYWDMAFDPDSPYRQGELLRELTYLDPALENHPRLDRWLSGKSSLERPGGGPSYPNLTLASARRRAYFEWTGEQIAAVTADPQALALAGGRNLEQFKKACFNDTQQNQALCELLCRGISQLENLPSAARLKEQRVPLRVSPRTPTETSFWVEKPLDRFRLEAAWPRQNTMHMVTLPRMLRLVYRSASGRDEALPMGYELFSTLLALAEGEQLGEAQSDDTFANLAVFVQRLAQEDEAHLYALNPKEDSTVFRLRIERNEDVRVIRADKGVPSGR